MSGHKRQERTDLVGKDKEQYLRKEKDQPEHDDAGEIHPGDAYRYGGYARGNQAGGKCIEQQQKDAG